MKAIILSSLLGLSLASTSAFAASSNIVEPKEGFNPVVAEEMDAIKRIRFGQAEAIKRIRFGQVEAIKRIRFGQLEAIKRIRF